MRYFALATDYDGTLATNGTVLEPTLKALTKLKNSGRILIMVTGRELPELKVVFPHLDMFNKVVAENGALLYDPQNNTEKQLVESPNIDFVNELVRRGVDRLSVGKGIIATWLPYEKIIFEAIKDFGLELQVIFNKDALMILPSGMNKGTGLKAALDELKLSPYNVAGIGDAENDFAFLTICGFSAAVENALPMIKEKVSYVSPKDHGAGVVDLIEKMLEDDLKSFDG
ncbi:MAG TPA: HAD family hydrolase [Ignavibacteriaceae bacterium]|nr:HAD family hydrolase [Ignavibacteriaceae bacterium]